MKSIFNSFSLTKTTTASAKNDRMKCHSEKTQDKALRNEKPLYGHALPLHLRGCTQWRNTSSGLITI